MDNTCMGSPGKKLQNVSAISLGSKLILLLTYYTEKVFRMIEKRTAK